MGKFGEGFERAKAAEEAREAEARRRAELVAAALKELSERIGEDGEVLNQQGITLRVEHGGLVLSRLRQPMASVSFDPGSGHFHIREYTASEGKTEIEAESCDDCALKLGEYVYSLKGGSA
jgi:hypothetical protein